jgi:hypothetical protein
MSSASEAHNRTRRTAQVTEVNDNVFFFVFSILVLLDALVDERESERRALDRCRALRAKSAFYVDFTSLRGFTEACPCDDSDLSVRVMERARRIQPSGPLSTGRALSSRLFEHADMVPSYIDVAVCLLPASSLWVRLSSLVLV